MKLFFGFRTSAAVDFSVTTQNQLPVQPPMLMIKNSVQESAISCSNNAWATTLKPGDYIVYLPASGDSWFDGSVSFTFSAPVTIVGLNSDQVPQAWSDVTGTVGANDAKNPLPPPNRSAVSAPPPDAAWLTTTLLQMNPSPARSADIDWSAPGNRPGG